MAILKSKEISEMKQEDLLKKLSELKLEYSREKAIVEVGGTSSNPGRIKEIRRTIAKINTQLNKIKKEKK